MAEQNNTITSIAQLKKWFSSGLKPLQTHFWAIFDSFYHKSENIPQDKIEDLAKTLSNKAETTAVDAKVNADASDLDDENVAKWKEVLGVGEVPDNMAKIDTESEQGNVHTKEQIEELLENSGKNIGNSDMKVPEGAERTLDLTGARLLTRGLPDVANDLSFNKVIVMNERGVWAAAPYMKYHFNSSTITINNIVSKDISPRPTFTEDVERVLRDYRAYQFEDVDTSTFIQKGSMMVSPFAINSTEDFIVEMQVVEGSESNEEIGLGRHFLPEFAAVSKISNGFWWYLKNAGATYDNALNTNIVTTLIFIKTGGVITIGRLVLNRIDYTSFSANAELGDYKIIYSPSLKIGKIKVKRL